MSTPHYKTHTVVLAITWLLVGCASSQKFNVEVSGLARSTPSANQRVLIVPGNAGVNAGVNAGDLQFVEFCGYLERALGSRGFQIVGSADEAQIGLVATYGISDPQIRQYTYVVPTWGQTGIASSQTTGTLKTFGNVGAFAATTTYVPQYGITGYQNQVGTYTTYFRYLLIVAYDLDAFRATGQQSQVWSTEVTSTGSSNDLRRVFPILAAAARPFLATNTGHKQWYVVREDDRAVRFIKGEVE
jgi:hypothetical protein